MLSPDFSKPRRWRQPTTKQLVCASYMHKHPTHGKERVAKHFGWSITMTALRMRAVRERGLVTTPKPKNQNG